jgi:hypothetical protein
VSAVSVTNNPSITPESWELFDLQQALTLNFPEPKWLVEGLVPEGTVILVSGLPHVGKTLDWLAAGIEAVTRHTVWGHFDATNVRRWLYVETEDPTSRVVQRIRDLSKGLGITPESKIPDGFFWVRTGPFQLVETEDKLRETLEKIKPDAMVLSTLQGLLGKRDLKSQSDMSEVNSMLVRLASEFCPIVLITHSPLNEKVKRAYGTVMQAANCGVTIHFERLGTGDHALIHATVDEKYERGRWDFTLRLQTEDVIKGDKVSKRPRRVTASDGLPRAFSVISVLSKIKTDEIVPSIRNVAAQTGVPKSTVARILKDQKMGQKVGHPVGRKKTRGTANGTPRDSKR